MDRPEQYSGGFQVRDLKWIILLLLACFAILVIVSAVSAEEQDDFSGSYAVSDTDYPYYPPYRLPYQGADVYVNDTVDISGQGWGSGIAWYGRYGEYDLPQYIREFTPYPIDQRRFYLDPVWAAGRSGYWYQYYGNTTERHGNIVSFKLIDAYRPVENATENIAANVTPEIKFPDFIVPEKHVADYLIAKGDSLTINESRIWIFGRVDGFYGIPGELNESQIQDLESGSYTIILQKPGNNTISDVGYNPDKGALWKTVYNELYGTSIITVDINALQPRLTMEHFIEMIGQTDDQIQTLTLDIEEPVISIVSIDDVDVGNRIPVAYEPGMTLLDVRGYTNTANGTLLTFVMDADKQTPRTIKENTYTTEAVGENIGDMRYYHVFIPINKNSMPNGIHTITASTELGGSMYYDFPISELPADSFVPNATIKYMGDRNPWIPTPPPEIRVQIQRETVVVTQQITVQITPSEAQISEEAQRIVDEQNRKNETMMVIAVVAVFGLVFFAWGVWSMVRARRKP